MKIIIPVENNELKSRVSDSFGRAAYFLVFDDSNDSAEFIVNSATSASGGAGIKAAQLILDNGGEVLLTPRCGENAAEVLKSGSVKIYKTIFENAEENLKAFKAGELNELSEIHSGLHKHGG